MFKIIFIDENKFITFQVFNELMIIMSSFLYPKIFDPYLHRLEILIKWIAKIFEEHKLCNFGIYGLLCFQTVWNNPLPCIHMELYGTMLSFVFIVYWYNRVCQCDLSLIFQLTLKTDDSFVLDTMSSSNNFINAPFPSIYSIWRRTFLSLNPTF